MPSGLFMMKADPCVVSAANRPRERTVMSFPKSLGRREFLKIAGAAGAAALTPGLTACRRAARSAPPGGRPNILFVMSDDHGYQAISCYGGRLNRTPQIDRLARDGVRFETSFCTNSLCAPSRAVLLTGKYSHLNGVRDNNDVFDGSQTTFPKLLQAAGYETAVFGKWHLKSDPTGFDHWSILPGQGDYYNPDFIEMGVRRRREGYVTDLITDDALAWLAARDKRRPFCALVHHKAPHRNWMPDGRHLALYEGETRPVPETFFDDYATRSDAARTQQMRIADNMMLGYDLKVFPDEPPADDTPAEAALRKEGEGILARLTPDERKAFAEAYRRDNEAFRRADPKGRDLALWKYQRYLRDYLRVIASVDENFGRLLDYLDIEGLAGQTVVVYTSDQGFYLGEHGWFDKRFMYEESLRMPLIVRYPPEISPHVDGHDLVLNLDYAPTFLDYAGLSAPAGMQGRSMRGVLAGHPPADWRQSIYYHYYEYPAVHMVKRHYGVRTRRHKLIHFYYDIDAWELYDLEKDPRELHNVYGDPAYAQIVRELTAELERLRRQYGDTEADAPARASEVVPRRRTSPR
jgi:arylsulfatase A-like enzyme